MILVELFGLGWKSTEILFSHILVWGVHFTEKVSFMTQFLPGLEAPAILRHLLLPPQ